MRRLLTKTKILIILVILLSIPATAALIHKGFFPTQDYIYVARVYELDKSVKDGQFPVRWVEDFRYGEPTFNFYAPLPYYVGSLIYRTGLTLLDSTKVLIALSFILSALAMFFLGRELFGNLGGIISAALYTYAPYHSVDVYVRGAVSEAWALVFFPLTFLFAIRLSKKRTGANFSFLALSLAGLFYTHNIMTLIFMPFFLGWVAFLLWQNKSIKLVIPFLGSLMLGAGLAASFLLPAFLEKNLVQSNYLTGGYFDFRGHFVEIKQFLSTFWGYGASVFGPQDGMSFSVGLPQWLGLGISLISLAAFRKREKTVFWVVLFLTAEFLFSLFMQHNKSTPIWLIFPILQFVQFPWRFLGISIFFVSLAAGSIGAYKGKWYPIIGLGLVLVAIGFNLQFFHPESYSEDAVDDGYVGSYTLSREERLPKDYLPVSVKRIESGIKLPFSDTGTIQVMRFDKHTSWVATSINVSSQSATVEVPITYFPGWTGKDNGQNINLDKPGDLGLIKVTLPEGRNDLLFNFGNSPIRFMADLLSIISLIIAALLLTLKKWRKFFKL